MFHHSRNFFFTELDSPDLKGSGRKMDVGFMDKLQKARDIANVPFVISSGYRTEAHNKKVGGVKGSSHTKGLAVDIRCSTSFHRDKILRSLIQVGFNRIGISKNFIHVDADKTKREGVCWLY